MCKKMLLVLLAALLSMTVAAAENADILAGLEGMTFEYSSGAGAWQTTLWMGADGAFTGEFHDSDMGDTGPGYPNGTVYQTAFRGRFADPQPAGEGAWTLRVASLTVIEPTSRDYIADGIRYIHSEGFGLERAQTVTLYAPGTPADRLPEDFLYWCHLDWLNPQPTALPYHAIWDEADQSGFVELLPGLW